MPEPPQPQSSPRQSGCLSREVVLTIIGSVTTIVAALIGLVPNWISSSSSDSPTSAPTIALTVEPPAQPTQVVQAQPSAQSATPAASPTAAPTLVEPVAEGEYMVLVAMLEPIGAGNDPTRFVVDNLQQALEVELPFSRIQVRAYPEVVTSPEAAQTAARLNGAAMVVWGAYEGDQVDLNVHIGVTSDFKLIAIPRDTLERTANIRLRLNNPRTESAAVAVMVALNVLHNADGNAYELLRTLATLEELQVAPAEVTGNSVAARVNRYFLNYFDNPSAALDEIEAAIALDPNPLLYSYRSAARFRSGLMAEASSDMQTALRIGPIGWTSPVVFISAARAFVGPVSTDTMSATLPLLSQIIKQRPNDWFTLYMRGTANYYIGDWTEAEADLAQAIKLGPDINGPHVTATLLALHQGRIADARRLVRDAVIRFPDPSFGDRVIDAFYGDKVPNLTGAILSAFGNLLLGQPATAVEATDAALQIDPKLADLYFFKGFAQCYLGEYAAAEAAYTNALELSPEFELLYVLRAEARLRQEDMSGARQDISSIVTGSQAEALADLVAAAQAGTVSCTTLLADQ